MNRDFVPSGEHSVRKIFPADQKEARDREARALQRAAGPGVPRLLSQGEDERTGRPFLEIESVGDLDLGQRVGLEGPLSSDRACEALREAARILERLHGLGLVHGDLKPANFVEGREGGLFLVDFEKATLPEPREGEDPDLREGFTGGTHGFAPPESYLGRPEEPGFDLFGLGATLHFLLTGFPPRLERGGKFDPGLLHRLRPTLPETLRLLLLGLLAPRPEHRPKASEILQELEGFSPPGPADLRIEALLLGAEPSEPGEWEGFRRHPRQGGRILRTLHWRRKLEGLLSRIPPAPPELPPRALVEGALLFGRAIRLCLRRLPRLPAARTRLEKVRKRLPSLLGRLPDAVLEHWQGMEIQEARLLARLSLDLCHLLSELNLSGQEAPHLIVSTSQALYSALEKLGFQESRQRGVLARIEGAEAELDLSLALEALGDLQKGFSGANRTTARIRDRLHRLRWLMERLVAGMEGIRKALERIPGDPECQAAAKRLSGFFLKAEEELRKIGSARMEDQAYADLSLTSRLLREIQEGYPKLDAGEVNRALDRVRLTLTLREDELIREMDKKLSLDPVPLRLLLRDLEEAEAILHLNPLVDRPELRRTDLLDQLERIRLKVEEVRDRNERLRARALEQAEEGKLTTVLYDLERTLHDLPEDRPAEEFLDWDLQKELHKVRQLRESIREAARRNLELAQAYRALQDDPKSSFENRRDCLDQREEVLLFLQEKGPSESQERYERDLLEVRFAALLEKSDAAEARLGEAKEREEQSRFLSDHLTLLRKARLEAEQGRLPGGRLNRLISRWEERFRELQSEMAEARRIEEVRRKERMRHRLLLGMALLVVLGSLLVPLFKGLLEGPRYAPAFLQSIRSASDHKDVVMLARKVPESSPAKESLEQLAAALSNERELQRLDLSPREKERWGNNLEQSLLELERSLGRLGSEDRELKRAIEERVRPLRER